MIADFTINIQGATYPITWIGLSHYLVLGAVIFAAGLCTMMVKRNAIGILIGVELVLNAGNINLLAFSRYSTGLLDGQVTAVFVIVLAAAEAAIALGIFLNYYNRLATVDVDRGDQLRR